MIESYARLLNLSFIFLLCAFLTSCSEDDVTEPVELKKVVYATGFLFNDSEAEAVYWRDSVPTPVTLGQGSAIAYSLEIEGDNVHMVGYENEVAKYWKNGVSENLGGAGQWSKATDIAIYEEDVYVVGYAWDSVAYWINGVSHPLAKPADSNPMFGFGNAIAVNENGVYVAGNLLYPEDFESGATYWENGVATRLSQLRSYANDIVVQNGNIYVAGSIENQAVVWKNGQPTVLPTTDGYDEATAMALFIDGTDVYVAGYSKGDYDGYQYHYLRACFWKNGDFFMIGSSRSEANSIVLDDNDLYVGGVDSSQACYWKNGVKRVLGNGVVYKIAVREE